MDSHGLMDSFNPTQMVVALVIRVRARDSRPSHDPTLSNDWRVIRPAYFSSLTHICESPTLLVQIPSAQSSTDPR
jgi:hypothetical protein